MLIDSRLRFLKQLRHLILRQPHRILLKGDVNLSHTIRRGVHQQKRILFIVSLELKTHPLSGTTSASLSQPPHAVKQRNIKSCRHSRTLHHATPPSFVSVPYSLNPAAHNDDLLLRQIKIDCDYTSLYFLHPRVP